MKHSGVEVADSSKLTSSINVLWPPTKPIISQNSFNNGTSINATCDSTANPDPNFIWKFDDQNSKSNWNIQGMSHTMSHTV